MPVPTVTEVNEFKQDLDDAESIVNGFISVATRLGGTKESLSQLLAKIVHGTITTYSAATTYTDIDEWVEESGIVYRPLPSALPIGPETFDANNWIVVQGFKLGDRLYPAVDDYDAVRAIPTGDLTTGTPLMVTDSGIRGHGVLTNDATANAITGITQANPAVVTYSGVDNWSNGDQIFIHDVSGMTEVNGNYYTVANVNTGSNTFELSGVDSSAYTAYTSGGVVSDDNGGTNIVIDTTWRWQRDITDNKYCAEWFGANPNTDDDSFCDAIQAIVDRCGDPANTSNRIPLVITCKPNTFYIKKAVYVNAKDGIKFDFPGRFSARFLVSSTYSTTVPATFPSDGLTYSNAAFIVIARRRATGGTAPNYITDNTYGAGAPWHVKIGGFYLDATAYSGGKSFDVVRAPEFAVGKIYDIATLGTQYILNTDDSLGAYAVTVEDVDCNYSVAPLKINRGTTMDIVRCSASHCDRGWDTSVDYSTYTSVSCDLVGNGEYAWDISGRGVVLNGCGAEYPYGGLMKISGGAQTQVTINGGHFIGGSRDGDPNDLDQADETDFGISVGETVVIDGAKVIFNNTTLRAVTEAVPATVVHLDLTVKNGGRVLINGNGGEGTAVYVQPEDWLITGNLSGGTAANSPSTIKWGLDKPEFEMYTTANVPVAQNGTRQVTFTGSNFSREIDVGPSYFTTNYGLYPRSGTSITEYRAPTPGVYNIHFEFAVEDADPGDYVYFSVTSQTNRIIQVRAFPGASGGEQIHLSDKYRLNAGDIIKIFYRSFSVTTDPVIQAGARFYGELN